MSSTKTQNLHNSIIQKMGTELGADIPVETFCILPFSHLSTTTEGQIRLCCRSLPIGNIKNQSLLEVWESKKIRRIRQDLLEGKRPEECQNCWKLEDMGIVSLRQGQNIARTETYKGELRKWLQNEPSLPPTLELKLSNRCNLKCLMCSPAASTPWMKHWKKVEEAYDPEYRNWVNEVIKRNDMETSPFLDHFSENKSFRNDFQKMAPHLTLLDFAGGEPLIDPLHYEALQVVIDAGQAENTVLRYSTNLTVLNFEKFNILDFWKKFKEIHLTISIDGHPKLNEYIRSNVVSETFEKNLRTLQNLDDLKGKLHLKGTTTISALNAMNLAETANYIANTLQIPWHTSRVTGPSFLDARIWDTELKKKSCKKIENTFLKNSQATEKEKFRFERHKADSIAWLNEEVEYREALVNRFKDYVERSNQICAKNFLELVPEFKNL